MAKPQLEKTLTSLAGEFSVAGKLCLEGYMASLTLKNYPGVDIFCMNPKSGKSTTVQVKTIRDTNDYFLPEHFPNKDQVFVFVHISSNDALEYFVVPAREVERISSEGREKYLRDKPHVSRTQPRMISTKEIESFRDRWDLLGLE